MSLDNDIRILSGVDLFEGFTAEQLRLMAFGAESISLRKGRSLYWEGGSADCAFVVASGSIALYRENEGQRQVLDIMDVGSILGEFALIAEGRRLTSAAAETDSQLLRLNRTMFRRILEEYPETALALQHRIADNLYAMIKRIERAMARFGEP